MSGFVIIVLAALGLDLVEKLISHRRDIVALKSEHGRNSASAKSAEYNSLASEVRELKARLDEQTILVDDIMRTNADVDSRIEQRIRH